jgi:hypothetical protein
MYCPGCGQPVALNQPVCGNCGRAIVQPEPSAFLPYNRVHRHLQTLGILWLAYSLFGILAWFIAMPFVGFIFGHAHGFGHFGHPELPVPLHWILSLATIAIYVRAALGLLVGFGLMRRERWARVLALIVAILSLLKLPFGTALGIYTLWVLLPTQSGQEYDALAASSPAM